MKFNTGDLIPDFEATIQDGSTINLSQFKGKKVVLFFYPKDNTPTCTTEACNLRDNYKEFQKRGYVILGVSTDSTKSHQKFIDKFDLPYDLISDPDKKLHELFGTWVEKQMYGRKYMGTARSTFIINEEGHLENIIEKVKAKEHTNQILS
ncbi:thioredoxin-dependent thiol peroxidase [Fulvivirgaceae bacterium BMA12]|uniref:thioredoxin-dependent peroxiredoxin n=1 Tax=Agaribacillus aureus TaxID=3051825 RepID=A0ABT8L917_9BACT|nr:thioredoxin-dependent thiol peroxidase [Fulvivirgaceae bacterium BMA12]